jgi:DNA repair photolyase
MSIRCLKSEIQCLNAVIGCTRGCEYCYARAIARRYHVTEDFSVLQFFPTKLRILDRKRPRIYFMTVISKRYLDDKSVLA